MNKKVAKKESTKKKFLENSNSRKVLREKIKTFECSTKSEQVRVSDLS